MEKTITDKIYFYSPNEENGWLANYSLHPIKVDGIIYKTVEHFFQAQKFSNKEIVDRIINATTPEEAKAIAKENKEERKKNWNDLKEQIMYRGIQEKFSQYKELKKLLLLTGQKEIIEKSEEDYFWGTGLNGNGENKIGQLLMKLRNTLIDN